MALDVGSRLGHYDVTALIGEGGMGQAYQAPDTKLNPQVALKILPAAFAADPDRRARFEREAPSLSLEKLDTKITGLAFSKYRDCHLVTGSVPIQYRLKLSEAAHVVPIDGLNDVAENQATVRRENGGVKLDHRAAV